MIEKSLSTFPVRIGLLFLVFAGTYAIHCSIDTATYYLQSSNTKTIIDKFLDNPRRIDIDRTGSWDHFERASDHEILIDPVAETVMILVEASIRTGSLEVVVVDGEYKPVHWQFDYRYVKAQKPGTHWIMTHIQGSLTSVMFGDVHKPFRLLLLYDNEHVMIENVYALEVNSVEDWDDLFYNEDFYQTGDGTFEAFGTNGYNVMPDKLDLPLHLVRKTD